MENQWAVWCLQDRGRHLGLTFTQGGTISCLLPPETLCSAKGNFLLLCKEPSHHRAFPNVAPSEWIVYSHLSNPQSSFYVLGTRRCIFKREAVPVRTLPALCLTNGHKKVLSECYFNGRMDEQMNGQMDESLNKCMNQRVNESISRWLEGWMKEWMKKWRDEWTNMQM